MRIPTFHLPMVHLPAVSAELRTDLRKREKDLVHGPIGDAIRRYPARFTMFLLVLLCLVFAILLRIPAATVSGYPASWPDALFTAVSAVCVSGLSVVDTGTYWSSLGQLIIILAVKIGGFGIVMLAAMLSLAVAHKIGVTERMLLADESQTEQIGEVRSLVTVVFVTSTALELATALMLFPRFLYLYGHPGTAAWHAIFYGISVFNNAGLILARQGFAEYLHDWLVCIPLVIATFVGSLGFPVILNIINTRRQHKRPWHNWSLHSKLTIITALIVSVVGVLGFFLLERTNPATLGSLPPGQQVLPSLFTALMRSAGITTTSLPQWRHGTWLLMDALMFIGGGSVSTAGGVKLTTVAVIWLAIRAEARGDKEIEVYGRRIPHGAVRVSMAVFCLGAIIVFISTLILLEVTQNTLDVVLFEAVSAYSNSGFSTGLTTTIPQSGRWVLMALMFVGRMGTMSFAAALASRDRARVIQYPTEHLLVG